MDAVSATHPCRWDLSPLAKRVFASASPAELPVLLPLLTSAFGRKVTMCRPWVRSEGSCFASWGHSSYINHLGFCTGGSSVLPTY